VLAYDRCRPHGTHNLILRHKLASACNQYTEDIGGARADLDWRPATGRIPSEQAINPTVEPE